MESQFTSQWNWRTTVADVPAHNMQLIFPRNIRIIRKWRKSDQYCSTVRVSVTLWINNHSGRYHYQNNRLWRNLLLSYDTYAPDLSTVRQKRLWYEAMNRTAAGYFPRPFRSLPLASDTILMALVTCQETQHTILTFG